jgi:hypothetical protein
MLVLPRSIRAGRGLLISDLSIRIGLLIASFALSAQTPTPPSTPPFKFTSASQQTHFPIELHSGLVFVPLSINGSRQLWFVLDSGSSRILIDRKVARSLGLRSDGVDSMQGAGAGRVPIELMHGVRIDLPGLSSEQHQMASIDLSGVTKSVGRQTDGLLGFDFLERFRVIIDYANKQMTVTVPEDSSAKDSGVALPLEFQGKWPFVRAELTMPGDVTVQDRFLVDSGSGDAVDHPIVTKVRDKRETTSGVGVGEPVRGYSARAKLLEIGGFVLKGPLVTCCGATDDTSRLIGGEILERFTVTFDYPHKQMRLEPNRNFNAPLP